MQDNPTLGESLAVHISKGKLDYDNAVSNYPELKNEIDSRLGLKNTTRERILERRYD